MSAIVAAAQRLEDRRIDAVLGRAFTRGDELRAMIIAAGRAIVAASNAAGAGRVVEGAPRFDIVGWMRCHRFEYDWAAFGHRGAIGIARHPHRRTDMRPTWLGGTWVWSAAAHDPRPCAWPRPFARGADR